MQERPSEEKTGPNRRAVLTAIGGLGVGSLAVGIAGKASANSPHSGGTAAAAPATPPPGATAAPACVLEAETTDGPYYLDLEKVRSDITERRPGLPLALRLSVVDATTCTPLRNAAVDIWHCDAGGLYSGYTSTDPDVPFGGGAGGTPPTGPPPTGAPPTGAQPSGAPSGSPTGAPPALHVEPTDNLRFLRGIQLTDRNGLSQFRTIYPGWYAGRAVHIHVKVHVGQSVVHTGQLFFPDDLTDAVYQLPPYSNRTKARDTRNDADHIYAQGGVNSTLTLKRLGRGYLASITMGVKQT